MKIKGVITVITLLFLLCGASASAFIAGGALYFRLSGPLALEKTVIIPAGSSTRSIAERLNAASILRYPSLFFIFSKIFGQGKKLKAGEYRFTAAITPYEIFDMLAYGRTIIHRFTVPEGTSTAQIVAMLINEQALLGDITPDTVKEGELLPETYFFSYGEEKQKLIHRMRSRMQTTLAALWPARAPNLPFSTPQEALILASMIEKETGNKEERPEVAAVFINRLRKNMKLQSDPTVTYAITLGKSELGRQLNRNDLKIASPYNTYFTQALPPAPITNPGKASLEAALHPAKSTALYFVADGKGGHRFASTLEEHNHNVALYRSGLNSAN